MNRPLKFEALDTITKERWVSPSDLKDLGSWFDAHWNPITPNKQKVCRQFTGLLDKNGKEIFEGDILKEFIHTGFRIRNPVRFERGAFINCSYPKSCEVVGNQFENPELLTEAK